MMSSRITDYLKKRFGKEPNLSEVDRRVAQRYIKRRLCIVYPELRESPEKLEAAYRALSLQPREGTEEGEAGVFFEMQLPH